MCTAYTQTSLEIAMRLLKVTALAVFMSASALSSALAQNAVSGSASAANNTANQVTASGAIASGGSVVMPQPLARQTIAQDGTATLKTAPSLGGLALGGGHPCALSPVTGQVSIIGGGLGYGGMKIDDACMLLIMAAANGDARAYTAATVLMAGRDNSTCQAMYQAGMVADCQDRRGRSTLKRPTQQPVSTSSRSAAAPIQLAYSKCEYNRASNRVTVRKARGFSSAVAKSQCLSSLGF